MAKNNPHRPEPRNGGFWGINRLKAQNRFTREEYIRENRGRDIPNEEWTPEHEMQLPPELREGFDRG